MRMAEQALRGTKKKEGKPTTTMNEIYQGSDYFQTLLDIYGVNPEEIVGGEENTDKEEEE